MPGLENLAVLDEHQGVALAMGPWDRRTHFQPSVFRDTLPMGDGLAERLAPFDGILLMRERTPFPAALIARLPRLRLLLTTCERNRGVDVAACAAPGVAFCGRPSVGAPAVDLTWALILGLLHVIPEQQARLPARAWQGLGGGSRGGRSDCWTSASLGRAWRGSGRPSDSG